MEKTQVTEGHLPRDSPRSRLVRQKAVRPSLHSIRPAHRIHSAGDNTPINDARRRESSRKSRGR